MELSAWRGSSCLLIGAITWGLLGARPARADNDVWASAANGSWVAGMSWADGSVPDSSNDTATFDKAGTYTATFSGEPADIGAVTITGSANVTFASGARPPNPIVTRTLTLVDLPGSDGTLRVNGGGSLTLGASSGTPAANHAFHLEAESSVFLSGGGTLTARFGSHLDSTQVVVGVAGQSGAGTLVLNSGTVATTDHVGIGNGGSTGIATVTGSGTRWDVANAFQMGVTTAALPGGSGMLTVAGGGVVESGSSLVGLGNSATATATVTGDGSRWQAESLKMGVGGIVQIQPGATMVVEQLLDFNGGLFRLQGGTLDANELEADTGFEWTAGTLHVATVDGDLTHAAGTLAPGHSAGVTNVIGDYGQLAAATLEMEIGGAGQGTEYDVLNATQLISLAGELDLKLINGFAPTPSQSFVIMNSQAGPIGGAFSNVANGARLDIDGGSFRVNYGAGSAFAPALVVLSDFLAAGPAGDFDLDGDVDGNDFLVWQRGGSPTPNSASDLTAWRNNFGAGGAVPASVPEPSAGALAAAAVAVVGQIAAIRRRCA